MPELVALWSQHVKTVRYLWDEEAQIYANKFVNNTFYRRISPTSFYALQTSAANDTQAAAMIEKWLLSPEHFCVALLCCTDASEPISVHRNDQKVGLGHGSDISERHAHLVSVDHVRWNASIDDFVKDCRSTVN